LKGYLIRARNSSVITQLNNHYRAQLPGGHLRAFCVSNKDYWEKRECGREQALPFLNLSGILALRRHCLSLVAESQLRIVTKYIEDDIPALLGDVELWVRSGAGTAGAEEKRAIRETLDTIEGRLKGVSMAAVREAARQELTTLTAAVGKGISHPAAGKIN